MDVDLAGQKELSFPGDPTFQYQGKVPGNKNGYFYSSDDGEAIFNINPNRPSSIHGHVATADGKHFTLEFCGRKTYAWKEIDTANINMVEKGELALDNEKSEGNEGPELVAITDDNTTIVEYSVKIYYTKEVEADTADLEGFFQQIIDETNLGYENSGIPLRIKAHCPEKLDIKETGKAQKLLNTLTNLNKKDYAKTRDGADVAALLVMELNYCGIAWINTINNGQLFSVTAKSCATGYYSFAHEIGHNIGANHNKEVASNPKYPYGLGHLIKRGSASTGYRTIMAYSKKGHEQRVNYWSNPSVKLSLTGTPTGVAGVSNNAALLTAQRFKLAAVGDEKTGSCIPTGPAPENGEIVCKMQTMSLKKLKTIKKVADAKACQVECQNTKGCEAFNHKGKSCTLLQLIVRKKKSNCTGTPFNFN